MFLYSVARGRGHKLKALKKMALGRLFGPKRQAGGGGCRILYYEMLHNVYPSQKYLGVHQTKRDWLEKKHACVKEKHIRSFSRKIERKEIIWTSRHRILEDNIKIDNKEIDFKDVD